MSFALVIPKKHIFGISAVLTCLSCVTALEMNFSLDSSYGEISSPNYPNNYPLNVSFLWTIKADNGRNLRLHFIDFQVEKAKRCIYDSLQVRDDINIPWKDVRKFCGSDIPGDIVTQNKIFQINFKSDSYNIVDRGFRIRWQTEDKFGRKISKNCENRQRDIIKSTKCTPATAIKVLRKLCRNHFCGCQSEHGYNGLGVSKPNQLGMKVNGKKVDHKDFQNGIRNSSRLGSQSKQCSNDVNSLCSTVKDLGGDKNIAVAVFSALLVIFVVINIVLMVFLWKRNKELDDLKSTTPPCSSSPVLDWIQCRKPTIESAEIKDIKRCNSLSSKATLHSKEWQNVETSTTPKQYTHCFKTSDGSQRRYPQHATIEQQRYFSLLSGIVRTPRSARRNSPKFHLNEEDSFEETSDVYVSSGYPSPTSSHCKDRFAV